MSVRSIQIGFQSGERRRPLSRFFLATLFLPAVSPTHGGDPASPTFHRDIAPIFRERCEGCHSGDRPKGKLSLSSFAELRAGGKKGDPVAPGDTGKSLLYQLITAQKKPVMPPEKEGPLERIQIERIRLWIESGCPEGEPIVEVKSVEPPIYRRPPVVRALRFDATGARLFVSAYREILLHRVDAAVDWPEARLVGEAEEIQALELAAKGEQLWAWGGSPGRFGSVQIWQIESRKLLRSFRVGRDTLFGGALSADGTRLLAVGADRSLRLLDAETGREVKSTEVHSDWVFAAGFTDDAARIVSGSRDRTLKIVETASGQLLSTVISGDAAFWRLAHRAHSAEFVVGGESRKPILIDAVTLKQVKEFEGQPGAIFALAASPDGKRVAVGGAYNEVRTYSLPEGKREKTFATPGGSIYALAFSPDGRLLAASGHDGRVRVFEAETAKELRVFVPVPIGRARRF